MLVWRIAIKLLCQIGEKSALEILRIMGIEGNLHKAIDYKMQNIQPCGSLPHT